jgi:glycosyltransferase involved in cell wall biosynthesis
MKVSVSMVTFNHEPYIGPAIESVLAQDFDHDLELIIGEDCSSDRTREIAQEYAAKHPDRVRLLPSVRRLGVMPNWLRILAECRGEYLAILDGDDAWTNPRKLRLQLDQLEGAPELQLSLHVCREVYADGRQDHLSPDRHLRSRYSLSDVVRGPIANSSSLLCRRRVIDELPGCFVEVPVGDWALQILSTLHGDIGFIDAEMSLHRNHGGGTFAGQARVRQRQMLVDTRRLIAACLPPDVASVAREAEFHDLFQQGRAYERIGEYRQALRCYAWCREHLDDAGTTKRSQVYRRALRARVKGLFRGTAPVPAAAAPRPPA